MARKVRVELIGDASSLDRAFKKAGMSAKGFERQASRTRRVAGAAFKVMGAGALVGGALVAKGLKDSIKAAMDAQKVQAQTVAVLKSTGSQAGVTSKHINNLATTISQYSGIDDEAVQATENLLLTFTKIQNKAGKGNAIFDQATVAVQDMSVALGQDANKAAIMLGKALNDPVKGVTSLRRVGVSLTQSQVDLIKKLESSGHHLEAQKLILKELKTEFGGSARAAGKTFGGQLALLRVNVENLEERIGTLLLPVLTRWVRVINRWLAKGNNQRRVIKAITQAAKNLAAAMRIAAHWVAIGARVARGFSRAVGGWKNALGIVLSGLLVVKLAKVVRWVVRLRKEMLLLKAAGGGTTIGPGGVVTRGGKGGGGLKGGLKSLGKAGLVAAGAAAVAGGVKAFSGGDTGNDFSQATAGDTFVGKNPYPKGSPGYQAWRAGRLGLSPRVAHTMRRDPAYQAGMRSREKHEHHISVNVDGKEVAKVVRKHHERGTRRTAAQRGGRNPGVAVQ